MSVEFAIAIFVRGIAYPRRVVKSAQMLSYFNASMRLTRSADYARNLPLRLTVRTAQRTYNGDARIYTDKILMMVCCNVIIICYYIFARNICTGAQIIIF